MSSSRDGRKPPGRSAISEIDPGVRENAPPRLPGHVRDTLNGYITPAVYRAPVLSSSRKMQISNGKRPRQGNAGPSGAMRIRIVEHKVPHQPERSRHSGPLTARASRPSQGSQRHIPQAQNDAPVNTVNTKKTQEIKPLWQDLDNLHNDEILRLHKRDFDQRRRVGGKAAANGRNAPQDDDMRVANNHAEIAPALRLVVNGVVESSDSDEDDVRYRPQPRVVHAEPGNGQRAVKLKAARKVDYRNTTSSESEDSDLETEMESSSSSASEEALVPDSPKSDSDVDMEDQLANDVDDMPDIVLLDNPPRQPQHAQTRTGRLEPPNELVQAVQALSLSVIRMQQTKQLPFLLRNLRQGFVKRCSELHIPIYSDGRPVKLSMIYEYVAGVRFQTSIKAWNCPLCNLLGDIKTREMLACHLEWDHGNVFCEWKQSEKTNSRTVSWVLRLLIPENQEIADGISVKEETLPATIPKPTPNVPSVAYMTPQTRRFISPFPSVSLSPSTQRTVDTDTPHSPTPTFKIENKPDPDATSSIRGTPSVSSTSSYRERSTTGTAGLGPSTSTSTRSSVISSNAGTSTARTQPPSSTNRGIIPPPSNNPLGPAAQYPYLPAESDYGGPTVYYSCRPNGPCLFDLLGTLPMEPFGILDWDIIDREEEIFENDNVKDEYKVIQALWMRWIMLNRNLFVSNYRKGCIAFVDQYWKIIHKAAGWDALRYQLLILLANQYLNGHDMAQVLLHYEELTDMANWYN